MTQELNVYSGGRWVPVSGGTGGESAITVHDGSIPNPASETPKGLEDSLAGYADGLHYFKETGSLLAITRQTLQTDITLTGPVSSVAKIVKSDAGLPTPQNPSLIVIKSVDGQWIKMTSDELDKPFDNPKTVDLFNPNLTGYATVDDLTLKADKLNLAQAVANNLAASEPSVLSNWMRLIITSPDFQSSVPALDHGHTMQDIPGLYSSLENMYVKQQVDDKLDLKADKSDTYTKKEVDDAREADKDFSIANDNVLLASITSLQEIVSNLGEVGTGQIDVLDAIRDVEIEPSMVTFSGDAASPIAWKGGLSLAPVKDGVDWRLGWNDGKQVHSLFHSSDFTIENISAVISGETLEVSGLNVTNGYLNFQADFALARDGKRLAVQEGSGPLERVAYLSDIPVVPAAPDLSGYAKKVDPAQNIVANGMVAKGYTFGDAISGGNPGLVYTDLNEGYGTRLVLDTQSGTEYLIYGSDLSEVKSRLDSLENKATPVAGDAGEGYAKLNDATQTIVSGVVQADRYRFDATRSLILLLSNGVERPAYRDGGKSNGLAFTSELAAYCKIEDAATKESVTLLQGQTQAIFDSIYTRAESDARYAEKPSLDLQVKRLDAAITEVAVITNEIAALKAATPTAAADINDPALDEFRKSIMDAVAQKLAGDSRFLPPEDILRTGTDRPGFFAQMVNGWIELIGTVEIPKGSSSMTLGTLPARFPLPDRDASYPVACREMGVNVRFGYISVNTQNRSISFSPGGVVNEVTVSGVRFKANWM